MLRVLCLLTVFGVSFASNAAEEPSTRFEQHVHPNASRVTEISYGRVKCMGCPMYFRFQASPEFYSELVKRHRLRPLEKPSSQIKKIWKRIKDAQWPEAALTAKDSELHWVQFGMEMRSDPIFRLALKEGDVVYFVTSGFF